jgi:hypothetical protein
MPSATYTLFRNAILSQQQVVCTYGDRPREGRWREGGSHKTAQRCVTGIDLDINIHVRKLR